ncbi:hypothetical protein EDD85DRAFT_792987 [Armillaria nabsnona]|nr:hypothetical protein EDD85DRAFT_792987 [Armillaria nabsnona]
MQSSHATAEKNPGAPREQRRRRASSRAEASDANIVADTPVPSAACAYRRVGALGEAVPITRLPIGNKGGLFSIEIHHCVAVNAPTAVMARRHAPTQVHIDADRLSSVIQERLGKMNIHARTQDQKISDQKNQIAAIWGEDASCSWRMRRMDSRQKTDAIKESDVGAKRVTGLCSLGWKWGIHGGRGYWDLERIVRAKAGSGTVVVAVLASIACPTVAEADDRVGGTGQAAAGIKVVADGAGLS